MAGADRMSPVLPEIVEDDQLAADNDVTASDFEIDSTFGDDNRSAMSQSIRSSIYNYRYENGRTYHAYHDGEYLVSLVSLASMTFIHRCLCPCLALTCLLPFVLY